MLTLVLFSGCTFLFSSSGSDQGLVFEIEDREQIKEVKTGDKFQVVLIGENKGLYDVDDLIVTASGFSPDILDLPALIKYEDTIFGSRELGIPDKFELILDGVVKETKGTRISQPVKLNMCYTYDNIVEKNMCIDTDSDTSDCAPSVDHKLSKAQGGPVIVTDINYESSDTIQGREATFTIKFEQISRANNLTIVQADIYDDFCTSKYEEYLDPIQKKDQVNVLGVYLGGELMDCTSSTINARSIDLARSESWVCRAIVDPSFGDYTVPLRIEFTYGVFQSLEQEFIVTSKA